MTPISQSQVQSSGFSVADYKALTKPGLVLFVIFTSLLSYYLTDPLLFNFLKAFSMSLGIYFSGSGVHVLNQLIEKNSDSLMDRTKSRPLCVGSITKNKALLLGVLQILIGLGLLYFLFSPVSAFVCLLVVVSYLVFYTPLKKITVWNTWVGAISGALPALIGGAIDGRLSGISWVIFMIVFFWQIPHFLSLAWRYREDYEKGGYRMLSNVEEDGVMSGTHSLVHTILLFGVSLLPFVAMGYGYLYLFVALALGGIFTSLNIKFILDPNKSSKEVFFFSLIYLPVLYLGFLADKYLVI